jgi:hypothetical protein
MRIQSPDVVDDEELYFRKRDWRREHDFYRIEIAYQERPGGPMKRTKFLLSLGGLLMPLFCYSLTEAERATRIDDALADRHHARPCIWWTGLGEETLKVLRERFGNEPRTWKRVRIAEVQNCFGEHPEAKLLRSEIQKDKATVVRSAMQRTLNIGMKATPMATATPGTVRLQRPTGR